MKRTNVYVIHIEQQGRITTNIVDVTEEFKKEFANMKYFNLKEKDEHEPVRNLTEQLLLNYDSDTDELVIIPVPEKQAIAVFNYVEK